MIFNDGMTDNVAASVLNSIEWRFRYNVLQGSCEDSPTFQAVVPDAKITDSGEFYIEASPLSGGQQTTIAWYRDEGKISLRIMRITQAR